MDKKAFLFGEIRSVELQTCREIIARHETVAEMWNIIPPLTFKSDDEISRFFYDLVANCDQIYTVGDVPLNRMPEDCRKYVCPLKKNGVPGHLPVILQVAALLGHRPTRYELSVANFAMSRFGEADANLELKYLALRDRLAQGATMFDEAEAARRLDEFALKYAIKDPSGVYTFAFEGGLDETWQSGVLDELALENRGKRFRVCFFDDELKSFFDDELKILKGKIVTSLYAENKALLEFCLDGYVFQESVYDERTGLFRTDFRINDPKSTPALESCEFLEQLAGPTAYPSACV